jgi:hypothetical protein
MAGAEGFEPSALGFGDRCSDQTELRPYRPKANSTQYDRGMAGRTTTFRQFGTFGDKRAQPRGVKGTFCAIRA